MPMDRMDRTILVVDDDPAVRETLRTILHDEGYTVVEASNGVLALDVLSAGSQGQVVLLDQRMPGMDGQRLLEALATDPQTARRHAYILLSAADDSPLAHEAHRLVGDRCVGVLTKPFDLEELLALIQDGERRLT